MFGPNHPATAPNYVVAPGNPRTPRTPGNVARPYVHPTPAAAPPPPAPPTTAPPPPDLNRLRPLSAAAIPTATDTPFNDSTNRTTVTPMSQASTSDASPFVIGRSQGTPRRAPSPTNDIFNSMSRDMMRSLVAHFTAAGRVMENAEAAAEASSLKKGKGRKKSGAASTSSCSPDSQTHFARRGVNGIITSTSTVDASDEFYRELEELYNTIDVDTDLYHLFLQSWFDAESRDIIRDVTEANLSFTVGMRRLVAAGMAIYDAFFILALVKFLRDLN